MKHTASEWIVDGKTIYSLQDCVWLGVPSKENRFWAQVQGHKCPEDEAMANAALMGSAPKLLEALQNMLGAFDNPIVRRKYRDEFTDAAIESARDAVAAATQKIEEVE